MAQPSTAAGGGSTQVSVSGYVAPSTQVSVSGYVAPSTQVSVSGYVAPSTQVSVSNYPAVTAVGLSCTSVSGQQSTAGDVTLISSNANALYVYAYAFAGESSIASVVRLLAGSTSERWRVMLQGGNSTQGPGVVAELAVSPPAYLFRTSTGMPLVMNKASSRVTYFSVAAWREG